VCRTLKAAITRTAEFSPDNTKGRWPKNLLLTHHDDCVRVGTREIRNESGSVTGNEPSPITKNVYGEFEHRPPFERYGGEDGVEVVDRYACVPECPARLLDDQSGLSATRRIETPSVATAGNVTYNGTFQTNRGARGYGDAGGASRFFLLRKEPIRPSAMPGSTTCRSVFTATMGDGIGAREYIAPTNAECVPAQKSPYLDREADRADCAGLSDSRLRSTGTCWTVSPVAGAPAAQRF
jgi:hypothetical protein